MSTPTDQLEHLIGRYARLMGTAIRRVCGVRHRDMVPDVEQELRMILWKQVRAGKEILNPATYLYRAALTTALTVVERQRPRESGADAERLEQVAEGAEDSLGLLPVERARLLEQLLGSLPTEQELALRAWLSGFNHREVARLLHVTEAVARHRIYRGMETLRRAAAKRRAEP